MIVKVLGPGCPKCKVTEELVRAAVKESGDALGADVSVEKVTDFKEIVQMGVLATPAVVVDGEVKCSGRVPDKEEIVKWLGA